jgi:hypothetical protein
MNRKNSSLINCEHVIQLLIVSLTFLLCASAYAQNVLKNGDFEQPLGSENWTVGYLCGGPDDWEIKGRNRGGSRQLRAGLGGYFRPQTVRKAHAYLAQTITNLAPNHVYEVSGWMREDYWRNPQLAFRDKCLVYIEAIGGKGDPTPDGRASVRATTPADDKIDAPYTYPTTIWRKFTARQTADRNGKIEVRLHYNKVGFTIYDKTWMMAGSFDDISVTP